LEKNTTRNANTTVGNTKTTVGNTKTTILKSLLTYTNFEIISNMLLTKEVFYRFLEEDSEIEILKDLEVIKNNLPEGQYEMIVDLVEEMYTDFGDDPVEVVQYAIIDFLNEYKERGKNLYISDELKNYFEKED
jgi:hypothetical protein